MHILYATDGSEAALAGAHLLARLSLTREWRVTLLTVEPEEGEGHAATALGAARRVLHDAAASIDTQILWGAADVEILRAVKTQAPELVVVGSRGLSGLTSFLVGSVSEEVARHASCSVLLARPLRCDLRAAVLGIDGSECSVRAQERLERFPLPRACTVHPVTVRDARESGAGSSHGTPWGMARVEIGDPAQALLRVAEECDADLIVVGSHGRTGVRRLLLGSVSEKVLRHARCSVLVVKPGRV